MRQLMKIPNVLLAGTMMAAPAIAVAQPVDGAGVGGNIMSDQTLKSVTVPPALIPAVGGVIPRNGSRLNGHISMNGGFAGEMSVGYGFGQLPPYGGPRVEIEGNCDIARASRGLFALLSPGLEALICGGFKARVA
jgi:hypothetical protein